MAATTASAPTLGVANQRSLPSANRACSSSAPDPGVQLDAIVGEKVLSSEASGRRPTRTWPTDASRAGEACRAGILVLFAHGVPHAAALTHATALARVLTKPMSCRIRSAVFASWNNELTRRRNNTATLRACHERQRRRVLHVQRCLVRDETHPDSHRSNARPISDRRRRPGRR